MQRDGDAVADDGGVGAADLDDAADRGGRRGLRRAGLGVVAVAGERLHHVSGDASAVRPQQRRPVVAAKVIMDGDVAVAVRQNQIGAGALEVAGEQQMGVGHGDGMGRTVGRDLQSPMRSVRLGRRFKHSRLQLVNREPRRTSVRLERFGSSVSRRPQDLTTSIGSRRCVNQFTPEPAFFEAYA